MGWETIVYTPVNPEIPVEDRSLLDEVPPGVTIFKTPIKEPYAIYKKFVGMKATDKVAANFISDGKKPSFAQKVAIWLRGNLFIPDPRVFWVKPSVRYLSELMGDDPVDLIVTSGPPHSMHLIGRRLKQKFGTPWIADFRDPWTNIDFYHELMLTPFADSMHRRLEKKVLTEADLVITVNQAMKEEFLAKGARQVSVISNGFDESDIIGTQKTEATKLTFVHIGTLGEARNPFALWTALGQLIKEQPSIANEVAVKLVGNIDFSVRESVKENNLEAIVEYTPYLPHNEAIKEQGSAGMLLLLVNNTPAAKGILTGKLFEYLAACRPILAIGPEDGEVAEILRETGAGHIFDFENITDTKRYLVEALDLFRQGKLVVEPKGTAKYSRRELTVRLASEMETLIEQNKIR